MITPLSEALAERGFDTLTPVQQAVTAADVGDGDLLVSAQTGSGKTVGFGLAIAPTLLGDETAFGPAGTPLALIVAPTRELAFQVMQELRWLYGKTGAMVNACVGGMDVRQERRLLERGTHIVVGTPGRLCDHIRRGALDLSDVRAVVLDEADEMLDLGFREDLEFILESAPAERRTLLFSATVSPVIAKLAEEFQKDAQRINTIDKAQQHADIAYKALRVAAPDADHAIFNLLRFHDDQSAIVFANTRAQVNHLTARLHNRGLSVVSLSGELSQSERSHALQAMRDGRARVCVATDVAARGIDLPNLNLVIHADLPKNTEGLLHRSGRTGRAGRKGICALIVPPREVKKAERLLGWAKINAEWGVPPSADDIIARDEQKLLEAPTFAEPLTEEEAAFAAKLLERHGPEAVAGALLRLHNARNSAPEDLQDPDTAPKKRETKEFGPSQWFALSVGRNDRAEARWLLPMILRTADLGKDAIGAIRVKDSETFVEIAEGEVAKFQAALGPTGEIQDGITVRPAEAPAQGAPRGPKPSFGDKPRYEKRDDKPAYEKRDDKPREDKPRSEKRDDKPRYEKRDDKPRGDKPKWDKPKYEKRDDKPRPDKPRYDKRDDKPRAAKPAGAKPAPRADAAPSRPDPAKARDTSQRMERPGKPSARAGKPAFGKGPGKPGGKPGAAKSFGKPGGKPAGKSFGKPSGKPGAPRGGAATPRRKPS
ncbi:DEAD/DEAH box helicase [Mesobacterium pallidum]|uniref:DEAD/DEAH box helicase n=1 Tax=Mesobacterium pallidum TaxID=2872037 RepID=UPI001EE162EE|nr:DEAD/DEAH box helicase [Mesobacterium pallidum]